ncbi:hypothetical protein ASE23_22665 [Rhizobium sp. Root73]|uniref:arsenic resistance N-acetyltransferase ArsN2 n=1 Tax=unclassified Rhizobium TaxID=2613769 RepID=UPI00072A769A|nr:MULTISPECIES: arsenic resistance N-acetyltransferase ArsN2 [unclassified Rhizobium]KQY16862.1 hypothetical protein ASD36_22065 [Rhizobium sp. Root1334]KRC11418.1 hypothetical protein ASE23_22665 [Rhizobium sp. Root73]
MTSIKLEPVGGDDPGLKAALIEAHLPTDDIGEDGRSFYRAVTENGAIVGYSGIEDCGAACLLRSLVILPEYRRRELGRILVHMTIEQAGEASTVYLATTTASGFFEILGFSVVARPDVPAAVLSTRQLSGICPASATIMKLTRPPT